MSGSNGRPVHSVVATVQLGESAIAALRRGFAGAAFLHIPGDDPRLAGALAAADVAVLGDTIDDSVLASPTLRWVHCDSSGLDRAAHPEVFGRDLIVTGSAGRSAPALAQHALYLALALTFDGPGLWEQQKRHIWGGLPGYHQREGLWGKTLGIVGLGHTGRELVRLGRAFGMRVLAHGRSASQAAMEVDRFTCTARQETADALLSESDVVVLACPLTDQTHHLIDAQRLSRMKRSAYLINLARGAVIDEMALVDALVAGTIAGAGLNVVEHEPLPADAPIWSAPNVIITPHATPKLPDREQRSVQIITENARRYRAGEPMLNVMRPMDRYSGAIEGADSADSLIGATMTAGEPSPEESS